MDFREKMMESMLGKMSSQEKTEMMEKMMEKFFEGMSAEERQKLMQNMMPKMMRQMMGGGPMMGMMGAMMGDQDNADKKGFNPMEMCMKMMPLMMKSFRPEESIPSDLRGLFNDWVQQIEEEILKFTKENPAADAERVAEHLRMSKDSVKYLLERMEKEGKIRPNAENKETK
jgi:hypothetical protein